MKKKVTMLGLLIMLAIVSSVAQLLTRANERIEKDPAQCVPD